MNYMEAATTCLKPTSSGLSFPAAVNLHQAYYQKTVTVVWLPPCSEPRVLGLVKFKNVLYASRRNLMYGKPNS